jgi:hypothetical protein
MPLWLLYIGRLLKKIPWQVYACAGLIGAFWLWGIVSEERGEARVRAEWAASIARGEAIVTDLKAGQNKITTKTEIKYIDRVKVIHAKGETIVKEIPVYQFNNLPELPPSFRVLYDAAATNTIPEAGDISNAATVSVTDVATITAQNFTQYYQVKAQLEELQDWVLDQRKLYLEKCKQRGVHCSTDN